MATTNSKTIPKSFSVDERLYPMFRIECEKRAISVSKWLRNVMKKQLDKWNVKY